MQLRRFHEALADTAMNQFCVADQTLKFSFQTTIINTIFLTKATLSMC